jgi:hypothetical protein
MTSLVQAAIAMLYDLGLDKPPSKDPSVMLTHELKGGPKLSRTVGSETMEERRVSLGCFLLSSTYVILCASSSAFSAYHVRSTLNRKGQTMRWTLYFDRCLAALECQSPRQMFCSRGWSECVSLRRKRRMYHHSVIPYLRPT